MVSNMPRKFLLIVTTHFFLAQEFFLNKHFLLHFFFEASKNILRNVSKKF